VSHFPALALLVLLAAVCTLTSAQVCLASKPLRHGWRRYFSLASQALYEAASAVSRARKARMRPYSSMKRVILFDESGRIRTFRHVSTRCSRKKEAEGWDYLSVSWEALA